MKFQNLFGAMFRFSSLRPPVSVVRLGRAWLSGRRHRGPGSGRLGETSVFVQTGTRINELPVVVKKVNDVFDLYRKLGLVQQQQEDTRDSEGARGGWCPPPPVTANSWTVNSWR